MDIVSFYQVRPVQAAYKQGQVEVSMSLDLNITTRPVSLSSEGIKLSNQRTLSWTEVDKISKKTKQCFLITPDQIEPVQLYSPTTKWVRSLYPTPQGIPTTLVAGFVMHRIKDINPLADTKAKVACLLPLRGGIVLDTATGLGYSALELSTKAWKVETVEYDPTAIELARYNPWSAELFTRRNLTLKQGDVFKLIDLYPPEHFTHILHDPPTIQLAGDLYSGEFYAKLAKVLKPKGKLFHYVGNPNSKQGSRLYKGVKHRLAQAGFTGISERSEAFGLIAHK